MNFSITDTDKDALLSKLKIANLKFQQTYPGDKPDRQPVHTVYGGANLFKSDTCIKMGEIALKKFADLCAQFCFIGRCIAPEGIFRSAFFRKENRKAGKKAGRMSEKNRKADPAWLSYSVYNKIIKKLKTEAS